MHNSLKKEQPKQPSYDELLNPKLLYTDEHDNLGNLWKKDTYVYDDKGQIIEVKSVDNEGKPLFRYTYKYDAKGREIERINYIIGKTKCAKSQNEKYIF